MKINDANGAGVSGVGRSQELTTTTVGSKGKSGGAGQQDQVSLSNLGSALGAQQTDSPERDALISQLSATVASGAYQVDPQAVSASIIESHIKA